MVGAASRTKIRNQIYKRFSQLKKGVNLVESSSSSGMNEVSVEDADGDGEAEFVAPTDGCTLLLDGSLVYCLGDTQLSVPDGDYPQATVVVEGGNLYATTDIVGADRDALGLVVFEDMTGVGGTIYIDKEVTDLVRVNIYSDGSVQSYDASSPLDPTPWADLAGRSDALTNQLYIGGSVVSANTVGGLATLYYANDPATTEEQLFDAAEQDLNNFREFQVCWFAVEADPVTGEAAVPIVPVDYDLDGSWWDALQGAPDAGDVTSCGADYGRSATLDALGPSNNEPLRLEYIKPPSGLPLLGGL